MEKMNKLVLFVLLFVSVFLSGRYVTSVKADANYCHPDNGQYPWTVSDENSNNSFPYLGNCPDGQGKRLCQSNWCNNNQPGDQCLNIDGKQTTIPAGDHQVNGNCFPVAGSCPTACGQPASRVPDGLGGFTSCNATLACDPAGQCPTTCGYPGGTVPNGDGGVIECASTSACVVIVSSTPEPTNPPAPPGPPGPKVCDAKQPPAPLLLSVTRTSPTTALLKWSPVTPSTYYVISYGTDPNNMQFGVPNTGNTDNFTVGALNPNLNYYFNLRAVNDCMPSDPSAVLGTGQVLGASTGGQVLGASTDRLAATHSDFGTVRAFGGFAVFGLVFASGVQFLHGKEEK